MYKYNAKLLKLSLVGEGLLIISSIWTMIVFPYLLGQLIFGLVITLLTSGLIYVANKDLAKNN